MIRSRSLPPEYDLHAVVTSHGWIQLSPFTRYDGDQRLGHVMELDSGTVVCIDVAAAGDHLNVEVLPDLTESEERELWDKLAWMLGLDVDLSGFYEVARSEPKLMHVIAGAKGRLLRSPTLFEDVVKTILTTNTTWAGTRRMVQSLVTMYGAPMAGDSDRRARRRARAATARPSPSTSLPPPRWW